MSKEVKRYDPFGYYGLSALMHEDVLGDWVRVSDYEALLAERDAAQKDAERYRWLRMADWWNSPLCVIRDPKQQAKPGTDCPSRDRLDEAIDAAQQGEQP
ncbi:hypothetical protein RT21_20005 [Pseudomonas sp. 10B238]|uniref:hypothetical protein n=1 Tax=Pseudomonas sp. 10B238 TaxID=1586417 RepID=UPI000617FAFF|nr:hypothetical protein [Pseudomonas sp. 10B238]KJJ61525.1 hypothetical protein RT21_20005 [Pseudomonas sp. 10B238]